MAFWRVLVPVRVRVRDSLFIRDFAGRFGLDFSMAVVAVQFILYLVRFCSSKSCTVFIRDSLFILSIYLRVRVQGLRTRKRTKKKNEAQPLLYP